MATVDDPFSVFGDADDSDEDEPSWVSQQIIKEVNERMQDDENGSSRISSDHDESKSTTTTTRTKKQHTLNPSLWSSNISLPWNPPLYLGPMMVLTQLEQFGGGRAYVSNRDIPPGTLLMVEEPLLTWPLEQLGKPLDLISVKHILLQSITQRRQQSHHHYIHDLEELHPTKETVDAITMSITTNTANSNVQVGSMMTMLQEIEEESRVHELVEMAKEHGICNRNQTLLSATDILRLLLVLRYNGLESGIYLHVAMLNHACQPNCVKFLPKSNTFSEVRATKYIQAGDPLTISYLPDIKSHATRRYTLWDQHRFDIGKDTNLRSMELVHGNLPKSNIESFNSDAITATIEQQITVLEDQFHNFNNSDADHNDVVSASGIRSNHYEHLQALELLCHELYINAKYQLKNENHLLLLPCLRLHLDVCDELLQNIATSNRSFRMMILIRLIISGNALLSLELQYHGRHHFALAKTCLELYQALKELLSSPGSTRTLLEMKAPGLSTFAECSALEQYCKRDHERIKALYPYDANDYIGTNQGDCQQS